MYLRSGPPIGGFRTHTPPPSIRPRLPVLRTPDRSPGEDFPSGEAYWVVCSDREVSRTVGAFHLSKWYLDCVSEEGTAVVGYFARLRWRSLGLEYAAALVAPEDGAPRQVHALRSLRPPALSGGVCTWRCEAVGVQAEWRALDAPVRRELLRTPAGSIRWTLHQPRSEAHIRLAGDLLPGPGEIRGLGYVEELELTMPPWQLPFDVLLWGRFL